MEDNMGMSVQNEDTDKKFEGLNGWNLRENNLVQGSQNNVVTQQNSNS